MYLGVEPKIGVVFPPKWMVKIMENPIKMDDLGGFTPIFGNTHLEIFFQSCPRCKDDGFQAEVSFLIFLQEQFRDVWRCFELEKS